MLQPAHVARELDGRDLHAEAEAEVGNLVHASEGRGANFPLDAAVAETARHQNARHIFQKLRRVCRLDLLGINKHKVDAAVVRGGGVRERLVDAFVGVL